MVGQYNGKGRPRCRNMVSLVERYVSLTSSVFRERKKFKTRSFFTWSAKRNVQPIKPYFGSEVNLFNSTVLLPLTFSQMSAALILSLRGTMAIISADLSSINIGTLINFGFSQDTFRSDSVKAYGHLFVLKFHPKHG